MWGTEEKGKGKNLLVDYEKDIASALKVRLKGGGYEVVLAFDSIQGIVMAKKEQPQVIILEMMIPGEGGLAVAERLKVSTDTCDIPIIFLTGIPELEERAYKAGAFFHLMKPYNPCELLRVIKKALEPCEKGVRDVGKIETGTAAAQTRHLSYESSQGLRIQLS